MGKPRMYGMKTSVALSSKADMRYRKKQSAWAGNRPPENPEKKKKGAKLEWNLYL